jgi:hypothetical protein
MTPHELRATLDRLDLSAAEAGHLLGVHRATIYRWLDCSMSVPIVVELLLRLMVRRGIRPAEVTTSRRGQTSAKPRSGRSQAKPAKPIVHHNTRARSKQAAVLALLSPAAWRDYCGHDAGDRLAGPFGARLPGRGGTQEARADTAIRQDGGRARLSRDPHRRGHQAAGGLTMLQRFVDPVAIANRREIPNSSVEDSRGPTGPRLRSFVVRSRSDHARRK